MDSEHDNQWDEERYYTLYHSDESPILSYRYDRHNRHYAPYVRELEVEREKRSTLTTVAKFFLFCVAMILFCVLMYIPVFSRANYQLPKGIVAGWSAHTNRDTKIYVLPNNVTTINEPNDVCQKTDDKLLLLIFVYSSTSNFERRMTIRQTWGNYKHYINAFKILNTVKERYKKYNFTYNLYPNDREILEYNKSRLGKSTNVRNRRNISITKLFPEIAKALAAKDKKTDDEKRFENDEKRFEDDIIQDFDMNKELNEQTDYDYNYNTNVMKIPPRGFEDENVENLISRIKQSKSFPNIEENLIDAGITERDFKMVFLLGLPQVNNDSAEIQGKIDEEAEQYGDIIQEGFIDSYNNLTLKSIMMLKWVTNNCLNSVRYILKTDDDMFVNVPNLVLNLRRRAKSFDKKAKTTGNFKEYLLIGDLIAGAKPVQDSRDKWYSPSYMYRGRVYPRYLSGTGYALSVPAAKALYEAALRTSYFHLEDIYITGICAAVATPRIIPRKDEMFSYSATHSGLLCWAILHVTSHRVSSSEMKSLHKNSLRPDIADKCERMRLTQVRKDRLNPPKKKLPKKIAQ